METYKAVMESRKDGTMSEIALDYTDSAIDQRIGAIADPLTNNEHSYLSYKLLLGRRRFLAGGALIGVLLFGIIGLLIPAKYESVTQLMPPDQSYSAASMLLNSAADKAQSLVGLSGDLLGVKTSGATFTKILTSQTVEDALITKFDLRRVYWVSSWQSAREKLEKNTIISEDRKSGVIGIVVRDRHRERAMAMCQEYVNQLNSLSASLSTSSARREREFLEKRLAVLKQELDRSSSTLGEFSSNNTTVDIPQQSKATVEAMAALQGQLIAAESELQGLRQVYADKNVRIVALQSRISELRRNLHLLTGEDSKTSGDSDFPEPSIKQLPLLGVTYGDLLRRTKIDEAVYEALTKQYELAKVQEAKDTPAVRVLDPPSYPEKHVYPPRLLIAAAGFWTGLVLAGFWVIWTAIRPEDPTKRIVLETYTVFRDDFIQSIKRHGLFKETRF